jgi:hypothetical protein
MRYVVTAASLSTDVTAQPGSTGPAKETKAMAYNSNRTQRAGLDQRSSPRTFEYKRLDHSRRRAKRTHLFDEVFWHRAVDPKFRRGILVGVSSAGLALVTEHHHAVRPGMQITPDKKDLGCRWRDPVVVTRVDRLSDMLDLVAAEYPGPALAMA